MLASFIGAPSSSDYIFSNEDFYNYGVDGSGVFFGAVLLCVVFDWLLFLIHPLLLIFFFFDVPFTNSDVYGSSIVLPSCFYVAFDWLLICVMLSFFYLM